MLLEELSGLPSSFMEDLASPMLLHSIYLCGFWVLLCFFISIISDNYSQVDKLWSIVPWFYVWQWQILLFATNYESAASNSAEPIASNHQVKQASSFLGVNVERNESLEMLTILTTLWGIRLTFNFYRRGGYGWPPWIGEEDYRWAFVRNHPWMRASENPIRWQMFNLFFICAYQHILLLLISCPVFIVAKQPSRKLSQVDVGLGLLFIVTLVLETMADNQQYAFQTEKHRKYRLLKAMKAGENEKKSKAEVIALSPMESDGFLSSGLFYFCRHPNYACEQFLWIIVYLFSVQVQPINWTIIGSMLLSSLFFASSQLSESITAGKYKNYSKYTKAKWMFLPFGGSYAPGKEN